METTRNASQSKENYSWTMRQKKNILKKKSLCLYLDNTLVLANVLRLVTFMTGILFTFDNISTIIPHKEVSLFLWLGWKDWLLHWDFSKNTLSNVEGSRKQLRQRRKLFDHFEFNEITILNFSYFMNINCL